VRAHHHEVDIVLVGRALDGTDGALPSVGTGMVLYTP